MICAAEKKTKRPIVGWDIELLIRHANRGDKNHVQVLYGYCKPCFRNIPLDGGTRGHWNGMTRARFPGRERGESQTEKTRIEDNTSSKEMRIQCNVMQCEAKRGKTRLVTRGS
jgi:hypothetical protein